MRYDHVFILIMIYAAKQVEDPPHIRLIVVIHLPSQTAKPTTYVAYARIRQGSSLVAYLEAP